MYFKTYSNFKAITRCNLIKDQRTRKVRSNLWHGFAEGWLRRHRAVITNLLEELLAQSKKIWRYCWEYISLKFRYTDVVLLSPCFIGSSFIEYRDIIPAVLREKAARCWWETARAAGRLYLSPVPQLSVLQQLHLPTFTDSCCLASPSSAPKGQILPLPLLPG